jgi:hypothetical protein
MKKFILMGLLATLCVTVKADVAVEACKELHGFAGLVQKHRQYEDVTAKRYAKKIKQGLIEDGRYNEGAIEIMLGIVYSAWIIDKKPTKAKKDKAIEAYQGVVFATCMKHLIDNV